MGHETDTLHFNVTLVGTLWTASVQAAEAELDELVQDSIESLDNPDDMVPDSCHPAWRDAVVHHKRPSRAARSFLTGVVFLEREQGR